MTTDFLIKQIYKLIIYEKIGSQIGGDMTVIAFVKSEE